MKGKVSQRARSILADRDASGKLMNYVVKGKEGTLRVGSKKYSVRTHPKSTVVSRDATTGQFITSSKS